MKKLIPFGLSLSVFSLINLGFPVDLSLNPSIVLAQTETSTIKEELTQESIKMVLDELNTARNQKDVEGMLKHIAPFAHSVITVESNENNVTVNLDGIEDHRTLFTDTYRRIKNRNILNSQTDIRVYQDGQMAIVVLQEEQEITTQNGETFFSESNDVLRFGLVNGKPMVVSATLKGWIEPILSEQ